MIGTQVVLVLVGGVATLVGGAMTIVPRLRYLWFAPSIASADDTDEERAVIQRAEAVVRRGVWVAKWPLVVLSIVAWLIAFHVPTTVVNMLVVASIFSVAIVLHMIAVRWWWQWALGQGVDMPLVEELVEDRQLVWRRETWFGQRQRRTWMTQPAGAEILADEQRRTLQSGEVGE